MIVLKHDVDPQGDLLVILREPNSTNLIPEVSILQPTGALGKLVYQEDTDILNLPKVRSMLPADDGSGKRLFSTRNVVDSQEASGEEVVEVHFKVSSQHMELASPVFRRMLNGPWSESAFSESPSTPAPPAGSVPPKPPAEISKGSRTWPTIEDSSPSLETSTLSSSPRPTRQVNAHGWKPEALLLVLDVIHGMNDEFPLVAGVEFLAEVAAIVDYYQCQRAVKLAGEVWYQTVYRLPRTYGKRCVLWLFIAWAFGWKDDFSKLASFVIEHGEGLDLIKSNAFPITAILEKLDTKRQECISKILTRLDELYEKLSDSRAGCDHRCSSMLLGSLIRERKALPLLDPDLQSPYTGYSVYEYAKKITCLRETDWEYRGWAESHTAHKCTILRLMEPLLKTIDDDIKNFNVSETG